MGWKKDGELVRTLTFKLGTEHTDALHHLQEEFRNCYNQYLSIIQDLETTNRRTLEQQPIDTDLIENTRQLARDKAARAVDNYFELKEVQDNTSFPRQKDTPMTATLNHRDGYVVTSPTTVKISTVPYNRIKASITGSKTDEIFLRKALHGQYEFGTADIVKKNGDYYIHITIRTGQVPERDPEQEHTYIGVDINEDNIMLSAVKPNGEVLDTLYLDYNMLKDRRNELFTRIKRLQEHGKWGILQKFWGKEKRVTKDFCHKLSRYAVRWITQFEDPVVVLEDLTRLREGLDYGVQMNKRLHRLPFHKLQQYIKYKAEWSGVPVMFVEAEYTSQRCPLCGAQSRQHRRGDRFKCKRCGHQDHADRNASINIALRAVAVDTPGANVPSPKNFPSFHRVRVGAAGPSERADPSPRTPLEVIMPRRTGRVHSQSGGSPSALLSG